MFGADRQDSALGEALEGATLEVRVACVDPDRGAAWFAVLDARADRTGEIDSVMSGRLTCDGTEISVSTTAPFSGTLQVTFFQVPDSALLGYAILSTN